MTITTNPKAIIMMTPAECDWGKRPSSDRDRSRTVETSGHWDNGHCAANFDSVRIALITKLRHSQLVGKDVEFD